MQELPAIWTRLWQIANAHIYTCLFEDAAQGVMSTYKGRYLGTIGAIGCYSFHRYKEFLQWEKAVHFLSMMKNIMNMLR